MFGQRYWVFTAVFWLAAGLGLFLSALNVDHLRLVTLRFIYFPMLGFLFTSAMTLLLESEVFRGLARPLVPVVGLAIIGALLTAMILNPLTFLLVGLDLKARHYELMSNGVLTFALCYLLWTSLYYQLRGRRLLGPPSVSRGTVAPGIEVTVGADTVTIAQEDIECVLASGDYVEIHLDGESHLKKTTITSLESSLDPSSFHRVHRSAIVNARALRRVASGSNGTFELTLASGRVVSASRSYRPTVEALRAALR